MQTSLSREAKPAARITGDTHYDRHHHRPGLRRALQDMALRLSNAAEKFLTPAGTSAFAYHGMSCVREVAIADLESARRTVESDWANQPFAAQSAIVQAGRVAGMGGSPLFSRTRKATGRPRIRSSGLPRRLPTSAPSPPEPATPTQGRPITWGGLFRNV